MLVLALLLLSATSTVRGDGGGSEQSAPTMGFVRLEPKLNNFLIVAPSGKNVSVTGTAILLNGIDIVTKLAAQDQAIATMQAQLALLAPLPPLPPPPTPRLLPSTPPFKPPSRGRPT